MLSVLIPNGFEGSLEKFLQDNQDLKIFKEFSQLSQPQAEENNASSQNLALKMLSFREVFMSDGVGLKNKIYRIVIREADGVKMKRYVQLLVKKFSYGTVE